MPSYITKVNLRYFKSIGSCSVDLGGLTIPVGANGSGKSNFVDSISFVSDSLSSTLDFAIRQRGGPSAVRKRSGGHPTHFSISLRMKLPSGRDSVYSFEIGSDPNGRHRVRREKLAVGAGSWQPVEYDYENGALRGATEGLSLPPTITNDRLALQVASTLPEVREVFDLLSGARFYSIYPEDFRYPQPHDSGDYLLRTGKNLPALVRNLQDNQPDTFRRICEYLGRIVTDVRKIDHRSIGPSETVEFFQSVAGQQHPWRFFASQMSDGTLRSLGILVALFQKPSAANVGLVLGIEEPEATIHPAACAVLTDAILEASKTKQILLTTHSPDLIDHPGIDVDSIRIVQSIAGDTSIRQADESSRQAVRRQLVTPGELLRQDQLAPSPKPPEQYSFLDRL
jgi:predicted ATPase